MASKSSKDSRPRIWAEGSQKPAFDFKAFGEATLLMSRESLAALLERCASGSADFGFTVASGRWRVPASRLGRVGSYLPSVERVGSWIGTGSEILHKAGKVIAVPETQDTEHVNLRWPGAAAVTATQPPEPPPEPMRTTPPQRTVQPAPASVDTTSDNDLAAIRAMMLEPEQVAPAPAPRAPARAPARPEQAPASRNTAWDDLDEQAAPVSTSGGRLRSMLITATSYTLGYGMLGLSLPVGAMMAGIAHAKGEDLRKLVDG